MAMPWNLVSDTIVKDAAAKTTADLYKNRASPTTTSAPVVVPAPAPAPVRAAAHGKLMPRVDQNVMQDAAIAEYRQIAAEIGISAEDILVEEFRSFLAKHDIPTFNMQEVVSYMDDIAAKDNPTKLGWHWCPVRPKDGEVALTFGRPSVETYTGNTRNPAPASDFYESHRFQEWHRNGRGGWVQTASNAQLIQYVNGSTQMVPETNVRVMQQAHDEIFRRAPVPPDWRKEASPAYTQTLPLHALKKIALVEKNFTAGPVVFLVTDYTIRPDIIVNPDPFLMAVIPNSAVAHGKGRFIIDVWDEPGFGIDRMVR